MIPKKYGKGGDMDNHDRKILFNMIRKGIAVLFFVGGGVVAGAFGANAISRICILLVMWAICFAIYPKND